MTQISLRFLTPSLMVLALGFAPACGGNGGANGGGADEPTPITERTSRSLYDCRLARNITDHAPRVWDPWPVMTAAPSAGGGGDGTAFLGRLESMPAQPFDPVARELVVSTFGVDGTLGPAIPLPGASGMRIDAPALAPRGSGFAAAWVAADDTLLFATFDAAGQPVMAATPLDAGLSGRKLTGGMRLVAGADGGFALLYGSAVEFGVADLRLLVIGSDGTRRAPPRQLAVSGQPYSVIAAEVAATADGYALVWVDPTAPRGRIVFAKADATGAETVGPKPISVTAGPRLYVGAGGFTPGNVALLAVEGGYLAGWTEGHEADESFHDGWMVTRLVRLDATGTRQGVPAALRAPVADVDEAEPSLLSFTDGAVAVLWARGSHIYVCGGCIPDHRIDMMLVDPADLVPLSNVVSVLPGDRPGAGPSPGGLLSRSAAVVGSSVLTAFNVNFHVHHTSASAAFACE